LLQARSECSAFQPNSAHQVVDAGPAVFALWRHSTDGQERILCLNNVTSRSQTVRLNRFDRPPKDIITRRMIEMTSDKQIELEPYQVLWLTE
jgi:hypothetical protein